MTAAGVSRVATCFFVRRAKHSRIVIATVARYFSVTFRPLCVKRKTHVARTRYLSVCPTVRLSVYLSVYLSRTNLQMAIASLLTTHGANLVARWIQQKCNRYFRRPINSRNVALLLTVRRVQKTLIVPSNSRSGHFERVQIVVCHLRTAYLSARLRQLFRGACVRDWIYCMIKRLINCK